MARGWESKSVEAQIELAHANENVERPVNKSVPVELRLQKNSLLLSRKRVAREIERSRNPRHTQILRAALDDLDKKLSKFGD
jgi:hypothetical protein